MSIFDRIVAAAHPAGLAIYGTSVQYEQAPEAAAAVTMIWSESSGRPDSVISAWCPVSSFPVVGGVQLKPVKGDRITKGGHVYKVVDVAFDGDPSGSAYAVTLTLRMIGAA